MSYKPGIIIQARTGSSRLPDKVVRPFYKGRSILEILIDRFNNRAEYKLVVATTTEPGDDTICEICKREGVPCFRGSVENVLERFYMASSEFMIDPVVRVCSDNPFLLQSSPTELIEEFRKEKVDYIGYELSGNRIGIRTHFGLWSELLSRDAMRKILKSTSEKSYLEHVTNYLYDQNDKFRIIFLNAPDTVYSREDIRLTIDSESDFLLGKRIYEKYFNSNIELRLDTLIALIDGNHDWKNEMKKCIGQNEK